MTPKPVILLVEDEAPIREMLRMNLQRSGFDIQEAGDAEQAKALIFEQPPALILMDWMLPGLSGIDFSRHLKKQKVTQNIPIIMLTARAEEADKVHGLNVGADDYVTKPFSPRELSARINAVLRRSGEQDAESCLRIQALKLYPEEHRLTISEQDVHLGPTEFRLLQFFMMHRTRVYSRSQVLDKVWGNDVYIEERTVDVHIRRLRKALVDYEYDHIIQTVHGVGYRFSEHS
ncbi:phosphate regulon transcriptional regulator PhoB [Candidatus Venteria ishoeyi]|uniref:phosphate regulon transcriptional regulator PhoB n=1 Tax=Candidatus Venteria ishoeyi TaxID=1899563 RepID=UPI0025A5D872|nr:phosphate regulon transcriptional regulator PhoB [Candidatus Venteria ishoeyi]MDM8546646.1 phosphate regulon transcriptional regulator PhoB [Candidatus Venteria ishoeyi]